MAKSERKEQYADYARRRTGRPCPSSTALRGFQHLGVAHHLFRASPKLPDIVLPGPAARGEPRDNSIARLKIEEALHPAGVEKVRRFANCKRSDGLLLVQITTYRPDRMGVTTWTLSTWTLIVRRRWKGTTVKRKLDADAPRMPRQASSMPIGMPIVVISDRPERRCRAATLVFIGGFVCASSLITKRPPVQ